MLHVPAGSVILATYRKEVFVDITLAALLFSVVALAAWACWDLVIWPILYGQDDE